MKDAKIGQQLTEIRVSKLFVADTQEQARWTFWTTFFCRTWTRNLHESLTPSRQTVWMNCLNIRSSQPVPCVKAIESVTGRSASIKWVNDIYMDGKKVCGILSEAVSDMESGRISHIIIGIGLNFSVSSKSFPADLQEKATSVFPDGQASITRNQLISKIWQKIVHLSFSTEKSIGLLIKEKSFVIGKNRVVQIRKERLMSVLQRNR